MSSRMLCGDVSSGTWKLNFIDKVADDGQQRRTCLVGSSQQKICLFLMLVRLSLCLFIIHIYISSENLQTPNAREGWGVILIWVNKVKAWQWKQINHADGWSLKLHKHLKSSQRWFVLSIIYIWPRNEKWWEGSHVINNKIDVDNKPISEQHHWWFVIYFFRSTVQMTTDGKKTPKKTSSSFYFLWSQVMTHLHYCFIFVFIFF